MKCCATNCKNRGTHTFPKDPARRESWERALRIPNFKANKRMTLCDKHFREEDYYGHGMYIVNEASSCAPKFLNKTAVPSLFDYNNFNQDPAGPPPKIQMQHNNKLLLAANNKLLLAANNKLLLTANDDSPGCSVHFKSEVVDENQINENTIKVDTETEMICRTCLTENAIIPLADNCDDGCTLGAMLEKIADVTVEAGLPDVICSTCAEDLRNAIAFRRRAQLADRTLHQKTRWRLDGEATDILSCVKIKSEPSPCDSFETTFPDSTYELVETVNVYKLEPNTGHTDNLSKIITASNNNTAVLSKKGNINKLKPSTSGVNKRILQIKPKENDTVKKNEPVFVDVTKKQIKLKPVRFQDVLKAIGPDKLPLHIQKKILQNKLNKRKMPDIKQEMHDLTEPTTMNQFPKPGGIKLPSVYSTQHQLEIEIEGVPMQKQAIAKCKNENAESIGKQKTKMELNKAHNMDERVYLPMCPYPTCARIFKTNSHLELHIKRCHLTIKPIRLYVCTKCGRKFKNKSVAITHMRTHRVKLPDKPTEPVVRCKKYQCEECGQLFIGQLHLLTHVRSKHTGEKPYKCTVCDKCFVHQGAMVKHRETHLPNRKRPFICAHCEKGFLRKYNLEVHMQCHSDVRKFKCKECGKIFGLKGNLVAHEKHVHGIYKSVP